MNGPFPGSSTPGQGSTLDKTVREEFARRTGPFDRLQVRQLKTQWKHKISAVTEDAGITTRWWDFNNNVTRVGPSAEVAPGGEITTTEAGDYIVGTPALAGAGIRFGDADPVEGDGDDWWVGYTNRLNPNIADPDGGGVGVKYFQEGEGDLGGAKQAGPQEYVFFDSSVDGVGDLIIPRDRWNGYNEDLNLFRAGGFLRKPFTFYDEGAFNVYWGVKHNEGFDIKRLHTVVIHDNPMWGRSDMKEQMKTVGTNTRGYIDAAHFLAGERDLALRQNGEGRDGSVLGSSVTVNQGEAIPLISIRKRAGWENVNIKIRSLSVSMDASYYVFIATGTSLTGGDFQPPGDELPAVTVEDSEYAVLADNDATDVTGISDGVFEFTPGGGQGNQTSDVAAEVEVLGLAADEIATMGVVPVAATAFNGASLRWSTNF